MDVAGDVYVVDHLNHRIRKIDADGIITTYAGGGSGNEGGYDGDGGPATPATLNFPSFITLNSAGKLFIADRDNDRVRKVDPSEIITLVAGSGTNGFGGDGGPALKAKFDDPDGLAVGPDGSVYVSDDDNARIRRIDTDGVITTIAGTGTLGSTGDGGPAVDATIRSAQRPPIRRCRQSVRE